MTEETNVAPDAATLNPAPEPTDTPEVVEPDSDEPKANAEDTQAEDPLAKLQARFDRRINRATAAKYQADARAQQAEAQAAALAQELSQYRQPQEQQQGPPQVDPVRLANAIATVREITKTSNVIAKDGADRFKDFPTALATVAEEAGPLFTQHGFATPLGEAILTADDPARLLHYIGTRPDVAAELADLTPIQLGRRLDRIEAAMKAAPKVSTAPKPLEPVKGTGSSKDISSMSDAEFNAFRRRQIAQRR